jgi:hypothetical protein
MKLRAGELVVVAGIGCTVASLVRPWYETPAGNIGFWATFGVGAVLMLLALCAGVALVAAAALERESVALPVATMGWTVLLGLVGTIAAIVRVLERPQHASGLCGGAWLGLAGAVLILAGAWIAIGDERPSRYLPATPEPRPRP